MLGSGYYTNTIVIFSEYQQSRETQKPQAPHPCLRPKVLRSPVVVLKPALSDYHK